MLGSIPNSAKARLDHSSTIKGAVLEIT